MSFYWKHFFNVKWFYHFCYILKGNRLEWTFFIGFIIDLFNSFNAGIIFEIKHVVVSIFRILFVWVVNIYEVVMQSFCCFVFWSLLFSSRKNLHNFYVSRKHDLMISQNYFYLWNLFLSKLSKYCVVFLKRFVQNFISFLQLFWKFTNLLLRYKIFNLTLAFFKLFVTYFWSYVKNGFFLM